MYRLRLTYTYSSSANATTAATSINNVLAGWTNPVTAARVTRTNATLELMIAGLTEAQATALRSALWASVFGAPRTTGKFSLVRTRDGA